MPLDAAHQRASSERSSASSTTSPSDSSVECLHSGSCHVADPFNGSVLPQFQDPTVVLCERGVISFAEKARRAKSAGARILLVGQTTDDWPYTMTDSTNSTDLDDILVMMCRSSDLARVVNVVQSGQTLKFSSRHETKSCPICREDFSLRSDSGQPSELLCLPCNHQFCPSCVIPWLEQRNSCPLCRCELPAAPNASLAAEISRRADSQHARTALHDAMFT